MGRETLDIMCLDDSSNELFCKEKKMNEHERTLKGERTYLYSDVGHLVERRMWKR